MIPDEGFTRKTRASDTLNSARIGTFVLSISAFIVRQKSEQVHNK